MAKREPTEALHLRLPKSVVKWLDEEAPKEFESRAGLAAKIIIDRWREAQQRPAHSGSEHHEKQKRTR